MWSSFLIPFCPLFSNWYLLLIFLCLCREGSASGFGIRVSQSSVGSGSWVDDPITHHIIGLYINKEEEGDNNLLWPLILHIKGSYCILVLPLVDPRHVKAYARLCQRSDCGNAVGADESLSSLLLDLPSITGYGMLLAMLFRKIYHTRRKSHAILPSPLFWSSHYKFANSSQLQTDFEFIGKVLPFVVFLSLTCEAALECVVKWVQYRTLSWPWNFLPRMFLMIFFFFLVVVSFDTHVDLFDDYG